MARCLKLMLAFLSGLGWCGAAAAHDGHEHESLDAPHLSRSIRTWTHASGRLQVRGTFVAMHGDQVQLRRDDGDLIDVKLEALSRPDRDWVEDRRAQIGRLNSAPEILLLAQGPAARGGAPRRDAPGIFQAFQAFADTLKLRWDDEFFYVESNGIPDHPMMIGIRAWQQQVPLPQPYRGNNAWRIPLHPVPARQPMSAKENFFRGAIALAVNGVPIFNPIKNDGRTDTFLAGELDEYGGHCGRADDYHYHIAPTHLEPKVGKGNPLGYALDGYPIYGYSEPDGSKVQRLDRFNGHDDANGSYHYHATKTYPYLNGGFHGEVTERGGQVDPQPRAEPVRPALPPLRGARITGFRSPRPGTYSLTYEIRGRESHVNYTLQQNGSVTFQFVDSSGNTTTETYERRQRGRGEGDGDGPPEGRRGRGDEPPPRDNPPGRRPPREPGRRPPPPLMTAIDKDQDGELSAAEIAGASRALLTLDKNGDGRLSEEELRPERPPDDEPPPDEPPPRRQDDRPPPRDDDDRPPPRAEGPQGRRGPNPNDPNRRPWIQVHAAEMDANHDGKLTRQELTAETTRTFAGYDRDNDGKLSREEYEGARGVRSAMGGFVKQHANEIDANGDGVISRDELRATATRMFDRADRNHDGTLTADELNAPAPPRPPAGDADPAGQRPPRQERTKGQGQRNQDGARANARQTDPNLPPPFHTEVPPHPIDIILGRPTARSVTLSIVSYEPAEGYVTYGTNKDDLNSRSKPVALPAGAPVELTIDALARDTEYHYRLHRKVKGRKDFVPDAVHSFHTQRAAGEPFTFTVQADSHLDLATKPELYVRTLENALAQHPDFHIELGDTFMTDKFARYKDALSQYRAQRYYFGQIRHSAPLFFTLGNHDGENGNARNGAADNMTVWSANTRKRFYPNPYPDGFYTGNTADEPFVGKLGDYYAWEWGNALFVVLDPFWYTKTRRSQGDDYWGRTLGQAQYRWLEQTLETSKAPFKFVFIHHLVGGGSREARGGAEAANFFEWGGRNLDGTWAFDERRPGWSRPIHALLVDHGVSAVFHGHDHFYARQELDGVIYQLVPQPANPRYGTPRSAHEYGYLQGELLNGPGHLRVTVSKEHAAVAYILSVLPGDERTDRKNAQIVTTYSIPAREPRTSHPR